MSDKQQVPAIDGWYTLDEEQPHLIGTCCKQCGSYYFPKQFTYCKNPHCDSADFEEVKLSHTGKVWSYTNACYQPPEPYVAADPFEPYTLAAVQLEKEQMIVLGQVVEGVTVDDLNVGDNMILALEELHESDGDSKVIWKWKPLKN